MRIGSQNLKINGKGAQVRIAKVSRRIDLSGCRIYRKVKVSYPVKVADFFD